MTRESVITLLKKKAVVLGSQQNLAKEIGVTGQYLSDIFNGRRELTDTVLSSVGMRRKVTYIRSNP